MTRFQNNSFSHLLKEDVDIFPPVFSAVNIVDDLYYLSIIHLEKADGAHCQYCEWSQSQNSVSLSWSSLSLLNPQQTPWLWYTLAQSQVGISKSQLQGITLAYLKDRTVQSFRSWHLSFRRVMAARATTQLLLGSQDPHQVDWNSLYFQLQGSDHFFWPGGYRLGIQSHRPPYAHKSTSLIFWRWGRLYGVSSHFLSVVQAWILPWNAVPTAWAFWSVC